MYLLFRVKKMMRYAGGYVLLLFLLATSRAQNVSLKNYSTFLFGMGMNFICSLEIDDYLKALAL
jgi:hypothetical protein